MSIISISLPPKGCSLIGGPLTLFWVGICRSNGICSCVSLGTDIRTLSIVGISSYISIYHSILWCILKIQLRYLLIAQVKWFVRTSVPQDDVVWAIYIGVSSDSASMREPDVLVLPLDLICTLVCGVHLATDFLLITIWGFSLGRTCLCLLSTSFRGECDFSIHNFF